AKTVGNMTAMRHAQAQSPEHLYERSEAPALRVAHEEIAERLHARDRFQLFRIDEERIQRRPFLLAEQLDETDVLLDQIVGQQRDAEAALTGAQHAHDVVDDEVGLPWALSVAGYLGEPMPVLQVSRHRTAAEQHDPVIV